MPKTPKLLKLWYQNLSFRQKSQLAYTATSHHLQTLLASDNNYLVRCRLAQKPSLHSEHQRTLAGDVDLYVRYWLAKNPALTKEAKEILESL